MEKSKCKSIPFHVLMNPCNLIKIAKFRVRRDTESQDIFILYMCISRELIISTCFCWNLQVPFFGYRLFDLISCPIRKMITIISSIVKKKKTKLWENVLRFDQVSKELIKNWRLWHAFHLYAFLVNSSVKSINKTIKLFLSFVSIYTCLSGLQDFTCKFLSLNLSCFSLVTCL